MRLHRIRLIPIGFAAEIRREKSQRQQNDGGGGFHFGERGLGWVLSGLDACSKHYNLKMPHHWCYVLR